MPESIGKTWKEIATGFLKVGFTAYGGPAIMGLMQAEFQERRQWTSRARFLEGLALVNVLPGATATQLGIFLGHVRGGWWGGLLAGLCFAAPAFVIMLGLAAAYQIAATAPTVRAALYGLGPVVLAVFIGALVRLARSGVRSPLQAGIAVAAAVTALLAPLGAASILLLAGGIGVFLFHRRDVGATIVVGLAAAMIALSRMEWWSPSAAAMGATEPTLGRVAALFAGIGALTFGGGLTMVALMQEHVVDRLHWLTAREFVDGLALGQLTPGPVLMLAAYVGYKLLGVGGALVAAVASFLPSFVLMLGLLPLFERVRTLDWARAAIRGLVPGVIGVMAVALVRMAPYAAPDRLTVGVLVVATFAVLVWQVAPVKAMAGGSLVGLVRDRLGEALAWGAR